MTLTFTSQENAIYNAKISEGLSQRCRELTGNQSSLKLSLYTEREGEFAGGILLMVTDSILWIDSLWVEEEYRGQGVGKALLQKVYESAKNYHVTEIQLNTFFEEGRAFFLTQGFDVVAQIPHWKYGLDCTFMRKIF